MLNLPRHPLRTGHARVPPQLVLRVLDHARRWTPGRREQVPGMSTHRHAASQGWSEPRYRRCFYSKSSNQSSTSLALMQRDGIYRVGILEHFLPKSKQTPKPLISKES